MASFFIATISCLSVIFLQAFLKKEINRKILMFFSSVLLVGAIIALIEAATGYRLEVISLMKITDGVDDFALRWNMFWSTATIIVMNICLGILLKNVQRQIVGLVAFFSSIFAVQALYVAVPDIADLIGQAAGSDGNGVMVTQFVISLVFCWIMSFCCIDKKATDSDEGDDD